jgi:S1-C subfamily serine protease
MNETSNPTPAPHEMAPTPTADTSPTAGIPPVEQPPVEQLTVEQLTVEQQVRPKRRGPRYWRWYVAALALAVAVFAGAIAATSDEGATETAPTVTTAVATTSTSTAPAVVSSSQQDTGVVEPTTVEPSLLLDARAVGETAIPSVVTVQIRGNTFTAEETQVGSGSGVIYDNQGHIITNNHVATAGSSYEVVLSNGRIYPAEVVGTDPATDLAVLEITARGLRPIAIGSTTALTVGDPAVAVGSPLGLEGGPSLTVGVLSAVGRLVQTDSTTTLLGMLQTDAPITSGSSGGALVDRDGALIGITTAVGVSPVGVEGIGFATPVEIVTRVADEIIANGEASSPYLGVEIAPAMEDTSDGGSAPIGIEINVVVPDEAAAAAGLQVGDVVTAINGTTVITGSDLVGELRRYAAGTTIEVTLDDGRTVDVILGQRPDNL